MNALSRWFFVSASLLVSFLVPVLVFAQTPQPTCTLTANPPAIQLGGSVTLKWTSTNATAGAISHIGVVALAGSLNILPNSAAQTVFTGTFTGPGGTATCSATVTVTNGANSSYGLSSYNTSTYTPTPYTVDPSSFTSQPTSNSISQTPATISAPSSGNSVASFLVPCGLSPAVRTGDAGTMTNDSNSVDSQDAAGCNLCYFGQLIQNIINFLIILSVPLSAGLFAWAGILLFTSGANPGGRDKAKKIFYNVIIGLVIALSGYLIVQTLLNAVLNPNLTAGGWKWNSLQCTANRPRSSNVGQIFQNLFVPTGTGGLAPAATPGGTQTAGTPTGIPGTCGGAQCTAVGTGSTVTYKNADGTVTTLTGGSAAWRDNNPGNIIMIGNNPNYSGQIGGVTPAGYNSILDPNGKVYNYAVFATYEDGLNAMVGMLQTSPSYQALTIQGALARYSEAAAASSQYADAVKPGTGFDMSTPMNQLNRNQLGVIANVMVQVEGYRAGTTTH